MDMSQNFNITIIDSFQTNVPDNTDIVVFTTPNILQKKDIGIYRDFARAKSVFVVPPMYTRFGYICMSLISSDGNVIGEQRATHINKNFFTDLKCSDEINVFKTPFAKIFMAVDVDIFSPETIRIATFLGADLIISGQFINPKDYNDHLVRRGPWQQSQQNCIYIANVSNVAANIIGPCMVTQDKTGFLANNITSYPLQTKIIPALRDEAYTTFPIFDSMNTNAYLDHLQELER